jgi:uncharacterized membrane protein YdbT with pleckstrin-like domain
MDKLDNHLMPKETILLRAQIHEASIYLPLFFLGILLIVTFWWLFFIEAPTLYITLVLVGMIVYVGPHFIRTVIAYLTTEFAVTNQRIIAKRGLFRREITEIFLHKVESIRIDQGIAGRLFDYGKIDIIGTGGTHGSFVGISKPFVFRENVNRVIEEYKPSQK